MNYRIRVKGHLDQRWSEWFEPLTIANIENGEAVLVGDLVDQAALHGMLAKVRDLGLPLVEVQQSPGAASNDLSNITAGDIAAS